PYFSLCGPAARGAARGSSTGAARAPALTRLPVLALAALLLAGCILPSEAPGAVDVGAEVLREGPVALESPPHGARVDGRGVAFAWRVPGNVSGWSARVLVDGAGVDACPLEAQRLACVVPLPPGRTHRWAVEMRALDGSTWLSGERGLRTNAPPGPPGIDAGDEGSTQVPLDLRFTFQPARDPEADAVTYRVVVRDASGERVACEAAPARSRHGRRHSGAGDAVSMTVTPRDAFGLEGPSVSVNVTTRRPVVFVHGWTGDATTWSIMARELVADGFEVLDFDPDAPGLQLLAFAPDAANETIPELAATDVLPEVARALAAAGHAPDAPVDVVAHSMGGLVGRVLVEQMGLGTQVRTLAMVGTPNRGSPMAGEWLCHAGGASWYGSCRQMEEGSRFLRDDLGFAPRPGGTRYLTVGGTEDTVAPDRSVRLDGVPHVTVRNACHSGTECAANVRGAVPLTGSREVRDALLDLLAFRPGP
ncbi:MAG TPA: alpha/beta fold hydrolase, partial [Candidatus Thermoplasmatota archaeon]|nr:alpha/beta fold hydrolase [Candidatus Thermoplasmatota archaeon]